MIEFPYATCAALTDEQIDAGARSEKASGSFAMNIDVALRLRTVLAQCLQEASKDEAA